MKRREKFGKMKELVLAEDQHWSSQCLRRAVLGVLIVGYFAEYHTQMESTSLKSLFVILECQNQQGPYKTGLGRFLNKTPAGL